MADLFVKILGKDMTGGAFAGARGQMNAFQKDVQKAANSLKMLTIAAAGLGVKAALDFAKFDNGLREISTLLGDVSDKDLKKLGNEIKNTAKTYGQQIDKMTKARYDIISAGFNDAARSAILLEQSARLAVAGVSDVATTSDVLTTVLNAYRMTAEQSAHVNDVLFTTVRLGKTTIDQLAGSFGDVAAIAPTVGVTLDEVAAGFATLTANGINTAESATALTSIMTSMLKPSEDLSKRIKELYGNAATATTAIGKDGFYGVLQKLGEGATEADVASYFPNVRALKGVFPIIGKASERLTENLKAFENSAGATDAAVKKMSEGVQAKIDQIKTSFNIWMIETGEKVIKAIEAFGNLDTSVRQAAIGFGILVAAIRLFGKTIILPIAAVYALYTAWDKNIYGMQSTLKIMYEGAKYLFSSLVDAISSFVQRSVSYLSTFGQIAVAIVDKNWGLIAPIWQIGQTEIEKIQKDSQETQLANHEAYLKTMKELTEKEGARAVGSWKDLLAAFSFGIENIGIGSSVNNTTTNTTTNAVNTVSKGNSEAIYEAELEIYQEFVEQMSITTDEWLLAEQEKVSINYEEWVNKASMVTGAVAGLYQNLYQYRVAQINKETEKELKKEDDIYKAKRASIIRNNTVAGKLTKEGQDLLAQLEQSHSDRIGNIRESARQKEKQEAKKLKPVKYAQAISNVALGVTEALKLAPPLSYILAAITAAAGAIEIATISSQPYASGTLRVPSGTDTVPAMLTPGEAVLPRGVVSANLPMVQQLLAGQSAGGSQNILTNNITFNVNAIDSQDVERFVNSEEFRRSLRDSINDNYISIQINGQSAEVTA